VARDLVGLGVWHCPALGSHFRRVQRLDGVHDSFVTFVGASSSTGSAFLSLFLVMFGGWAIGMRNMIIYELETDYAHYLEALGAPKRLIRQYAFRNGILPQLTGLALQLGVIVSGALATEIVFSYPGIGYLILQAVQNQDYFLLQGCFLFIIIGVLLANFIIDIVYVIVDPRTRTGMQGGEA